MDFVAKYPNFQQVKDEYEMPGGLTQVMNVPTYMSEEINMDFVVGLPQARSQNDLIWVIVDILTKSTHLIPVKSTYSTDDYARIYINEIVSLYGNALSIISDRSTQFTFHFAGLF